MALGAPILWRQIGKDAAKIGFPIRQGCFVYDSVFDRSMHSFVFFYRVVMPFIFYLLIFGFGIHLLLDGIYAGQ